MPSNHHKPCSSPPPPTTRHPPPTTTPLIHTDSTRNAWLRRPSSLPERWAGGSGGPLSASDLSKLEADLEEDDHDNHHHHQRPTRSDFRFSRGGGAAKLAFETPSPRTRRNAVLLILLFLASYAVYGYILVPVANTMLGDHTLRHTLSSSTLSSDSHSHINTDPDDPKTLTTATSATANLSAHLPPTFTDLTLLTTLPAHHLPNFSSISTTTSSSPSSLSPSSKKRLIFIGDVHGMLAPLQALLTKLNYDGGENDHLIFTGDLISKGPDSVGVLDLVIRLGASAVRGNHEDRALLAWRRLRTQRGGGRGVGAAAAAAAKEAQAQAQEKAQAQAQAQAGGTAAETSSTDDSDAETGSGEVQNAAHAPQAPNQIQTPTPPTKSALKKDRLLAKQLTHAHVQWLSSLPVILIIGAIPGMGTVLTVHAGLVPGQALEKQDPWSVMNMRTMDVATLLPSERHEGVGWTRVWGRWMRNLSLAREREREREKAASTASSSASAGEESGSGSGKGEKGAKKGKKDKTIKVDERMTVIYGHDSKRGLNLKRWSRGIDTGCVGGGELTALVIEAAAAAGDDAAGIGAGKKSRVKESIVSVGCEKPGKEEKKKKKKKR